MMLVLQLGRLDLVKLFRQSSHGASPCVLALGLLQCSVETVVERERWKLGGSEEVKVKLKMIFSAFLALIR